MRSGKEEMIYKASIACDNKHKTKQLILKLNVCGVEFRMPDSLGLGLSKPKALWLYFTIAYP